jgi:hypothetical protein
MALAPAAVLDDAPPEHRGERQHGDDIHQDVSGYRHELHLPLVSQNGRSGLRFRRRCPGAAAATSPGVRRFSCMTRTERLKSECDDLRAKIESARRACEKPEASERERSDLQMMEQELIALEQKMAHTDDGARPEPPKSLAAKVDKDLDAALEQSFPGSDPVSFVEAAPVKPADRDLPSVKVGKT